MQDRIIKSAWITLAVVVAAFAIAAGFGVVTASPVLCKTCHEIAPLVDTWETSSHTQVGCASCHEDHLPWYRFPQSATIRYSNLWRDVIAHYQLEDGSLETTSDVPDYRCLRCHEYARELSTHPGTNIDHEEHARRNDSCVSCHVFTAHPPPEADRALLLMRQCMACHALAGDGEAPGTCETCHTPEFDLVPASHEPEESTWEADHGAQALAGRDECRMCHTDDVCSTCHGLEMPHPDGWVEDEPAHPEAATRDGTVCDRCHDRDAGFCTTCHHETYDETLGTWREQHFTQVKEVGAANCVACHDPTFCIDCHTLRDSGDL
jgi:nitrate/TMAO reductase-like tetraheme cytochrome c subunit